MRLFIAINFNDDIKDKLYSVAQDLKRNSLKGNFTLRENIHLTLLFLGEVQKPENIINAINKIECSKFLIETDTISSFKRSGGDIFWIGLKKCDKLGRIYYQLKEELEKSGFATDQRDFKPHITIGREVKLKSEINYNMLPIKQIVDKISLMKSERIQGKLVYSEIYSKAF